jgi:hypothetical protein
VGQVWVSSEVARLPTKVRQKKEVTFYNAPVTAASGTGVSDRFEPGGLMESVWVSSEVARSPIKVRQKKEAVL